MDMDTMISKAETLRQRYRLEVADHDVFVAILPYPVFLYPNDMVSVGVLRGIVRTAADDLSITPVGVLFTSRREVV